MPVPELPDPSQTPHGFNKFKEFNEFNGRFSRFFRCEVSWNEAGKPLETRLEQHEPLEKGTPSRQSRAPHSDKVPRWTWVAWGKFKVRSMQEVSYVKE